MSAPLRFFYDIVCPYAAMASLRVDGLAAACGLSVHWSPVLLGGLLRAHGGPDDPNRTYAPARAAMTRADIVRQAALHGRTFAVPAEHPRRTVAAMRLVVAARSEQRQALSAALFEAYWQHGQDVADPAVLEAIARRFGMSAACVDDPAVKAELRARTDEAAAAGVFGVPTFVRGDVRIWGCDRMGLLARALGGAPRDEAAAIAEGGEAAPARVRFFFDVASPYSYLAFTQLERVCAAAAATLVPVPVLLGALFREIGTADVPLFEMHAAKQAWVREDLAQWAAAWGVPFRFPSVFPLRSLLAQRVIVVAPATAPAIHRAAWVDDRRIDEAEGLAAVLAAAGFDARELLAQAGGAAAKQALRANTDAARDAGACGVPSYEITRDGASPVLLWGQDRLATLATILGGWSPPPTPHRV
ncbi:MAG: DsbA family protein [Deltaproteobacteria bacterium]|nr:DsbA family protein [Deltaproteobacteria bacterium]MBK8717771.1 DsbA family protein [Deltaproteobacteria bacterium]MBP7288822.1 DsbA family protein [Nannocystaceae bacterium]